MKCHYCGTLFGSATANYNEDRRIETAKGPVHMKCLAYFFTDLGMQRAFGELSGRDREILEIRLRLPTASADREGRIKRYRKVGEAARSAGTHAPEITNRVTSLMNRLEKRSEQVAQQAEMITEVRDCIARASKILGEFS